MSKDHKRKTNYITVLSVVATMAVVWIHAQFAFLAFSTERYWLTTNILRSIFYFCVPIFFMISGATLVNYQERYDTKTFFLKRFKKVVIPFIAWGIIALFYHLILKDLSFEDLTFTSVFNGIFSYQYQDVYWYIPACISVYLSIPLLSAVDKSKRKKIFSYLAITCFVLNILIPFLKSVFSLKIAFPIDLPIITEYLFYVVVGYLLHEYDLSKKIKVLIYVLGILGLILGTAGTYFSSIDAGKIIYTYLGYCNVPCVLYSIFIFVFIKDISKWFLNNKFLNRFITFFGKYTFSVYLIHMFVRGLIVRYTGVNTLSIYYRLFSPILIITVSIIIAWLLRKIKFVREIVPE